MAQPCHWWKLVIEQCLKSNKRRYDEITGGHLLTLVMVFAYVNTCKHWLTPASTCDHRRSGEHRLPGAPSTGGTVYRGHRIPGAPSTEGTVYRGAPSTGSTVYRGHRLPGAPSTGGTVYRGHRIQGAPSTGEHRIPGAPSTIAAKLLKSFGRAVKLLKKEGKGGKKKGIQI